MARRASLSRCPCRRPSRGARPRAQRAGLPADLAGAPVGLLRARCSTCWAWASGWAPSSGDVDGIPYAVFVAPALLATSAMNGAIYDSTFNLFYKLKYARTYDAMLVDPDGRRRTWPSARSTWALIARPHVRGRVPRRDGSCWASWPRPSALLAVPASVLIGFAAAGVGTAATTFVRSLAGLRPGVRGHPAAVPVQRHVLPITTYPEPLRTFVEITPLYRGVHLIRGLTTDRSTR